MKSNKKMHPPVIHTTIDEKHAELMKQYSKDETDLLPQLLKKKQELKQTIKSLHSRFHIDKKMEAIDALEKVRQEIREIKSAKKKYLLENCSNIFDYFEERKKISSGGNNQNTEKVRSFFRIKTASTEQEEDIAQNPKYSASRKIYQDYWKKVDNEIYNIQDFIVSTDVCNRCNQGELIVYDEDGVIMCNQCSQVLEYIIDSSKPSNKEMPNEVSYTAYIRLNHFKEILSQFQAKETTHIDPAVIEAIKNRIKKERIKDIQEIDNITMREILKRIRLNKYFEHIQYINSLLGIKPPTMSEELINTLCVLFIELQEPWALYCPQSRTNFFNYTYTLYQLCVLLDQKQYLPYIPMLKDLTKQKEQDMIWKKMCQHLDWMYYPTI
jgi:hypothetical protein